jgi:uncharacterized membrane protein
MKLINIFIPFFLSMLPIIELRGGIPVAVGYDVPLFWAFVICFLGNILPVPIILFFIKKIFKLITKVKIGKRFVDWLEKRAKAKSDSIVKYQLLGLFLFVAIPLPGTGAWTGSLIAVMLDLPIKKAFPVIMLGVFTAGIIMLILSYFVKGLFF